MSVRAPGPFVRVINTESKDPYRQDASGRWWIVNPQTGWVEVPGTSRALQFAIEIARAR